MQAGFAEWLAKQECTDYRKAARDADTGSKEQWLAAKRASEQEEAAAWAKQFDMPPLEGPEKALGCGERSRHQLMTSAHKALAIEGAGERQTGRSWRKRPERSAEPAGGSTKGTPKALISWNSWTPLPSRIRGQRIPSADPYSECSPATHLGARSFAVLQSFSLSR